MKAKVKTKAMTTAAKKTSKKEVIKPKKEAKGKDNRTEAVKTDGSDLHKLEEARNRAHLAEVLKTAKELLKDDKENLAKLGKHELMAFYDKRFGKENDGKGAVMIMFADTLNLSVADTVLIVSCANVVRKESIYAFTIDYRSNEASIFRLDEQSVTMEDGKFIVGAYNKIMNKGKKKS